MSSSSRHNEGLPLLLVSSSRSISSSGVQRDTHQRFSQRAFWPVRSRPSEETVSSTNPRLDTATQLTSDGHPCCWAIVTWPLVASSLLLSRTLRALALSSLVVLLACGGSHAVREFRTGDCVVKDRGWMSYYPRIRVELPPVSVGHAESRVYNLGELPSKRYDFRLVVNSDSVDLLDDEQAWSAVCDSLQNSEATLTIEIVDLDRTTPTHRHEGRFLAEWFPQRSGERNFQSEALDDMELPEHGSVRVIISAGSTAPLSSEITLQPVLVGGGFKK